MNTAFVLAAGLGTRLRPLTGYHPKPLVPVCGVPLLAYSLALCARHGLREVVVNAHWLADQIEAWSGEREGVRVTVSTELPDVLGTGGGLKRVEAELAPTFVVLNGDVLHDVDLGALLRAVPPGGAAMALRRDPENAPKYGIVAADAEHTVVELTTVARAEAEGAVDRATHFTGIHAMSRTALGQIPDGFACVIRTAYRAMVPDRRVGAIRYDGVWLDAGDPEQYLDANLEVLSGRVALALDPFVRAAYARTGDRRVTGDPAVIDGVTVEGPVWIGPGARLGRGAVLDGVVVGAGASVAAGAVLRQTVIWDGQAADGQLSRAIVFPGGVLRV